MIGSATTFLRESPTLDLRATSNNGEVVIRVS